MRHARLGNRVSTGGITVTDAQTIANLSFDPPGPGLWSLDPVHFPRPVTRYWAETHPGPAKGALKNGELFRDAHRRSRDGVRERLRLQQRCTSACKETIPARFARAEEVFRDKLWREQLREWDEECKPSSIAAHREIQAVDPDLLSDEELVAYLNACRDHHAAMMSQHFRFTGTAVVPTGDFLAHVEDWTGLPPAELLGLMRGSASVSAGGSDELERLVARNRRGQCCSRAALVWR